MLRGDRRDCFEWIIQERFGVGKQQQNSLCVSNASRKQNKRWAVKEVGETKAPSLHSPNTLTAFEKYFT